MLYSPSIIDASYPALPLLAGSLALWDAEVMLGLPQTIELPLLALSGSLLSPTTQNNVSVALPLLSCGLSLVSPTVASSFAVIPSTTTGVIRPRRRAPNPYSETEMRRAAQLSKTDSSNNSMLIASVNESMMEIQSNLDTLEEEMDSVLESSDTTNSAEVDESIAIGQCLYMKNTGHVGLARANAAATRRVVGIAIGAAVSGHAVKYNSDGKLTKADWTSVAGSSSLSPGADYFLSPDTAGSITSTAPTATGAYVVRVGNATSTVIFNVEIETSILL